MEATKETALVTSHRFGAQRGKAHAVIRLKERGTTYANCLCLLNGQAQIDLVEHTQHNKVTTLFGLKTSSGFQASVADLHDLIGQW
jgi:hypothetical protein